MALCYKQKLQFTPVLHSSAPEFPVDTHVYTKDLGRSVTIACPFKKENAHSKKSLCKKIGQTCELVIDSTEYVNPKYKDRAILFMKGTSQELFNVNITHLRHSDAGLYVCQAGEGSSADRNNADLQVLDPKPELVYRDLRASVAFDCDLGREVADVAKYLCRMNKETCDVVINTLGRRDPAFEGRILLTHKDDNGRFSVLITGLKKEDAGQYLCGAHSSGLPQEGWPMQAWQLFVNEGKTFQKASKMGWHGWQMRHWLNSLIHSSMFMSVSGIYSLESLELSGKQFMRSRKCSLS